MPVTEQQVAEALSRWAPESSFVRQYVAYGMGQNGSPLAYHMACALGILAVSTPLDLELEEVFGGGIFPNVWMLLVGDQGSKGRKSDSIKLARKVLGAAMPELACSPAGSPQEQFDSFAPDKKPKQLIFAIEGGAFFGAAKGSQNMADYKPTLMKLYDGAPDERNTLKKKVRVESPRPSLLCGINPAFLGQYADRGDWHNGFLQRFVFISCKPERNMRTPSEPPKGERWEWLLRWLAAAKTQLNPGPCLGLSAEAEERYFTWEEEYQERRVPGPEPAIHGRGALNAAKIALLLGWDYGPGRLGQPWRVPLECMEFAIQIAEWHYMSLCEISGEIVTSVDMRDRRSVLRAMEGHPEGSWVAFGRIITDAQLLKRRIEVLLESLLAERIIERITTESGTFYRKITGPPDYREPPAVASVPYLPPMPPLNLRGSHGPDQS